METKFTKQQEKTLLKIKGKAIQYIRKYGVELALQVFGKKMLFEVLFNNDFMELIDCCYSNLKEVPTIKRHWTFKDTPNGRVEDVSDFHCTTYQNEKGETVFFVDENFRLSFDYLFKYYYYDTNYGINFNYYITEWFKQEYYRFDVRDKYSNLYNYFDGHTGLIHHPDIRCSRELNNPPVCGY